MFFISYIYWIHQGYYIRVKTFGDIWSYACSDLLLYTYLTHLAVWTCWPTFLPKVRYFIALCSKPIQEGRCILFMYFTFDGTVWGWQTNACSIGYRLETRASKSPQGTCAIPFIPHRKALPDPVFDATWDGYVGEDLNDVVCQWTHVCADIDDLKDHATQTRFLLHWEAFEKGSAQLTQLVAKRTWGVHNASQVSSGCSLGRHRHRTMYY